MNVETDILLPWDNQTYPDTTHSCPVFPFQKGVQFYLGNNKPEKDQKFPVVIVETMENVFSLSFVLLQHWWLPIPAHSDQTRIIGAFFPIPGFVTTSKNTVNVYFSLAEKVQRPGLWKVAGKEAHGLLQRPEKQNHEVLTPWRKPQRF